MHSIYLIYFIVLLALAFDFINGFHDAANSTATIVATGVLKPIWAVAWAAFFNFIAFLFFHLNVASTIGTGLISPDIITPLTILAALVGAMTFSLFTWYIGLPSSSSHALIGGLIGAGLAAGGWRALELAGLTKTLLAIIISPLLGMILAIALMHILGRALRHWHRESWARKLQFVSAALLSLGHGGNDAQKIMGIIAAILFSANLLGNHFYVPLWVVITCNFVMALGTFFGGWRIAHTLGKKITHLDPISGSCAETGAALTLFAANYYGIPVSTTHTITGAIAGVGTAHGWRGTNWKVMRQIVWAWLATIPAAAVVAAIVEFGLQKI